MPEHYVDKSIKCMKYLRRHQPTDTTVMVVSVG
uniref:Uncharacterized protein n=1 Tax=Anguilla anguilla TaxID=7936 RepID=A0A0E9T3H1_ANGAN